MKSVLILGAHGFIGAHIAEQLVSHYDVIAPSHQELDLENTFAVLDYFKQHNIDVVIHAANVGSYVRDLQDYESFYKNVRMFENLLYVKAYYKKLIILGSGAEYDKSRNISKVKEDEFGEYIPEDVYGFQKYLMARYAENEEQILHLRLFGVYGIGEDYTKRFISQTICRLLHNKHISIKQNVIFDYLYVTDFARLIETFVEKDNWTYTHYNVGSGIPRDLVTIAEMIQDVMGTDLPMKVEQNAMNKEYTCDISRLRAETPVLITDFRENLQEMVSYYKEHMAIIDSNLL